MASPGRTSSVLTGPSPICTSTLSRQPTARGQLQTNNQKKSYFHRAPTKSSKVQFPGISIHLSYNIFKISQSPAKHNPIKKNRDLYFPLYLQPSKPNSRSSLRQWLLIQTLLPSRIQRSVRVRKRRERNLGNSPRVVAICRGSAKRVLAFVLSEAGSTIPKTERLVIR